MHVLKGSPSRRALMRGTVAGVAVSVGVPLLDCFLDTNGTALANGAPMPVRMGTWFWGLGMDKDVFIPKIKGANYDLPPQIAAWKDIKQHVNLFTNFNVQLDGKPNLCHFTGWVAIRTGKVPPTRGVITDPSFDVLVADAVGGASRFQTLDAAATGSRSDSYSFRNADAVNPAEATPITLYQKVFGADFQDPNSSDFTPNPRIMVRKSVLSGIKEERDDLLKRIGAADRERLDQYFTSVRQLEQRLEMQLQKPPPAPNCKVPAGDVPDIKPGLDTGTTAERHKIMADIMAMAVACNQTRVFNMTYSVAMKGLNKIGLDKTHHVITHEEATDGKLGYQPTSHWFILRAQEAWADYVKAMASVPEGSGTLLDNCVILAHSEQELAKTHAVSGIPMMTAGKAGGRLKTGLHIDGVGTVTTRVPLTVMNVVGVPIPEWGSGSLRSNQIVNEILA